MLQHLFPQAEKVASKILAPGYCQFNKKVSKNFHDICLTGYKIRPLNTTHFYLYEQLETGPNPQF